MIALAKYPRLHSALRNPLVVTGAAIGVGALYGVALAYPITPLLLIGAPLLLALVALTLLQADLAVPALVGVAWGYFSDVAVNYHGLPSLLRPLIALFLVAITWRRFRQHRPLLGGALTWLMLAWGLVVLAGLAYASEPERSMSRLEYYFEDLLLFLVVSNLLISTRSIERSVWVLVGVGTLFGSLALFQELTGGHANKYGGLALSVGAAIEGYSGRPRAAGPLNDPNFFAQQMLVLVPLCIWTLGNARTLFGRAAGIFAFAMCTIAVGLTFSRGALLALGVMAVLFLLRTRLNPRYLLVLVPLVFLLLRYAPPELTVRFTSLSQLSQEDTGSVAEASLHRRSVEMTMAVYMFADHPFLGVGAGNYPPLYPQYIREAGAMVPDEERGPHSLYLEIAAEHGLAGILVFGSIVILSALSLRRAERSFKAMGEHRLAALALMLQISLAGYLVSATFLHGVYPRFLWLQVAFAVGMAELARRKAAGYAQRFTYTQRALQTAPKGSSL